MDDTLWVGLLDVRPGTDGTGGAYVYCAGRASSAAGALAAMAAEATEGGFEIVAVSWLSRHTDLSESQTSSEAVAGVVAALAGDSAALGTFFTYPERDEILDGDELKREVEEFVAGWIDGALEHRGAFELGDFAFVAEMQFPDDDATRVGWAFRGEVDRAPEFFARAIELAAEDD